MTTTDVKKAENIGRRLYRLNNALYNPEGKEYDFTEDQMDRVDVEYKDGTRHDEIKVRLNDIVEYIGQGYMYELKKKAGMDERTGDKEKNYINFFNDGYILLWNVNKDTDKYHWIERVCNSTTAGTIGKQIVKWVTFLPFMEASVWNREGHKLTEEEKQTLFNEKLPEYEQRRKQKQEEKEKAMIELTRELWRKMD